MYTQLYTLEEIMEFATKWAIGGVKHGIGGPFGACICKHVEDNKYEIISLERNTVVSTLDPTNHAEMNAIRKACQLLDTFDLSDCVLVTTGQSCDMCKSATIWANIKTVYYGTTYEDATEIGFRDDHINKHIKGEIKILDEIPLRRDIAIKCHEAWKKKEDKVQY